MEKHGAYRWTGAEIAGDAVETASARTARVWYECIFDNNKVKLEFGCECKECENTMYGLVGIRVSHAG